MTTPEPKKFDTDKPRYDLLPPKALGLLVDCLTYGAKKYDDYNWRKDGGIDPNRLFAATQRHLWAWKEGEVMDKESGLPHLAHAATNLLMMLDLACRPPVKIPNFNPKPTTTHSDAFKWLEALGPLSSEFELLNAGKTISVCKADEPTRKAIKKLQHYKLLSDNQDVRVGLHESEYMVDITPVGWEVLKALKSHAVTKEPGFAAYVKNVLPDLRAHSLAYDIVSGLENVCYFDPGDKTLKTLQDLELFSCPRMTTTKEGKECWVASRTLLGYDVYHWISHLSPGSWNYRTVEGPEDLVVIDGTASGRRSADRLSTLFDMRIDEKNAIITLHRTPYGHKIRSLLNALS